MADLPYLSDTSKSRLSDLTGQLLILNKNFEHDSIVIVFHRFKTILRPQTKKGRRNDLKSHDHCYFSIERV